MIEGDFMYGTQLKYDNSFKNIVEKSPVFWRKNVDIPKNIREFINDFSRNIILHDMDNDSYYCSCCLNELNDFYCSECNKQYRDLKYDPMKCSTFIDNVYSFDKSSYYVKRCYFVFDVVDGEVILYNIVEENSREIYMQFHRSSLSIEKAYWIRNDSIVNLITNNVINFENIDNQIMDNTVLDSIFFDYDLGLFSDYNLQLELSEDYSCRRTLYVDNLDILKDTIYKYSYIWKTKEFLKEFDFRLLNLTYVPLRFRQFEYLIKYKLYNLAYTASHLLNGKTFKERFGVDKEFLLYMQTINIDYYELLGLQLTKCRNKYLLNCVGWEYENAVELFKIISPNMYEFGKYLEKISVNSITEYFDYIKMAKQMGYDLTDKKVLYPENFVQEHNKLYLQYEILNNPEIEDSINNLSNALDFNIYEDDKYIIFPADSIESLIDEGSQQHNCLRIYTSSYGNNECQIYFMRSKSEKDKSFVTIEVRNNKIIQARGRFNEEPSKEIMNILRKWEKTLIPIENE